MTPSGNTIEAPREDALDVPQADGVPPEGQGPGGLPQIQGPSQVAPLAGQGQGLLQVPLSQGHPAPLQEPPHRLQGRLRHESWGLLHQGLQGLPGEVVGGLRQSLPEGLLPPLHPALQGEEHPPQDLGEEEDQFFPVPVKQDSFHLL
ncbi:hypothetical protein TthHB5008_09970 [Thermus thermophilus]|uniref:hypothetical protein n=1 Tax=Thermus thermophilus TaxID=274 RepID=UPI0019500D2B|nr:hypothetical protein [Thermus thermophilus]BCP97897.1 hypothetical protein TthHB5002_10000 [Thermus thermophilus]BCQ00227.1 hypothetical protein TthHB5008_09970 [Thermus thermophilus]